MIALNDLHEDAQQIGCAPKQPRPAWPGWPYESRAVRWPLVYYKKRGDKMLLELRQEFTDSP